MHITKFKDIKPGKSVLKLYHWVELPLTLDLKHLNNDRNLYLSDDPYLWGVK